MSSKPQGARRGNRIDTSLLPPSDFITTTMDLAVMSPAERDRKLITELAAKMPVNAYKARFSGKSELRMDAGLPRSYKKQLKMVLA